MKTLSKLSVLANPETRPASAKKYVEDSIRINKTSSLFRKVRSFLGAYLFSPIILFLSVVVYIFMPPKLIRRNLKLNIRENIFYFIKRSIDILGSLISLVISLPVFIIFSIAIKIDSKGPVFYQQTRIGIKRRKKERRSQMFSTFHERRAETRRNGDLYGKKFILHKFRIQ